MDTNIFRGGVPAIMTPCLEDRSPNYPALVSKAQELVAARMNSVVYCGSMGDWPLLSDEQRQEGVRQLTAAGVPVIVGTGAQNTASAVAHAAHAQEVGAFIKGRQDLEGIVQLGGEASCFRVAGGAEGTELEQVQNLAGEAIADAGDRPHSSTTDIAVVDLGIDTDHEQDIVVGVGDVLGGVAQGIGAAKLLETDQVGKL